MKKLNKILLLLTLFFAIASRFTYLNKFPPGISHDELELVLSAKSYATNFTDHSGVAFPKSLFVTHLESGALPIPAILLSVFFKLFGLSLTSVRVMFAVINIITAIIFGELVYVLTKKKNLKLLAIAMFLASPWMTMYSKIALTPQIALMFVLLGTLSFIQEKPKTKATLTCFLLAMFSYFGALFVVPIYAIILSISKKRNFSVAFLTLFFLISYLLIAKLTPDSTLNLRSDESFLNLSRFSTQVDTIRRKSIQTPLTTISVNKYTLFAKKSIGKYLGAFSANTLFLQGDPSAAYRMGTHGLMYYIDFLLIAIGLITGLKKYKKLFIIALTLIAVAPLGSVLNSQGSSYIFRSFLLPSGFLISVVIGLSKYKRLMPIFLGIYLLSLVYFLHFLFFQYSIAQAENHFASERVLVNYLNRANPKSATLISPLQISNQYTFYFDKELNTKLSTECPTDFSGPLVVESSKDCRIKKDHISIQNQKDSGEVYLIYNDQLCHNVELTSYRRTHKISDYDIESMSDEEFCSRWVFKY